MKQHVIQALTSVLAAALGAGIALTVLPEREPVQPEPVVVVCTWGHGCQETNQPVTP